MTSGRLSLQWQPEPVEAGELSTLWRDLLHMVATATTHQAARAVAVSQVGIAFTVFVTAELQRYHRAFVEIDESPDLMRAKQCAQAALIEGPMLGTPVAVLEPAP